MQLVRLVGSGLGLKRLWRLCGKHEPVKAGLGWLRRCVHGRLRLWLSGRLLKHYTAVVIVSLVARRLERGVKVGRWLLLRCSWLLCTRLLRCSWLLRARLHGVRHAKLRLHGLYLRQRRLRRARLLHLGGLQLRLLRCKCLLSTWLVHRLLRRCRLLR